MRNFILSVLLTAWAGIVATTVSAQTETAVFAGGCFWCVESDFEGLNGVLKAESGFAGGSKATANYKEVTKGTTKHVEAVKVIFDPSKVSYETLLAKFFRSVDPTDAGGQFCDRGASYATAIFAQNADQEAIAKRAKTKAQADLGRTVVTPIYGAKPFYAADAYHQDYYKSGKTVLTRFGLVTRKKAYKKYRNACGRDARVKQLWGNAAWAAAGS